MATWNGWQEQLLTAAKLPTAESTQNFLYDWSQHATSDCRNNPVDISHAATGATNCHKLTKTRTAKKYVSHAQAATAFSAQIHSGNFPSLLAALKTADPYQSPDAAGVAADFSKWGSAAMATYYTNHASTGSGSGSTGGGDGSFAHAHNGWTDLQHSINDNMPAALRASQRNTSAALRALSKARKVRL